MKKIVLILLAIMASTGITMAKVAVKPYVALEFDMGTDVKFFRAAPVALGGGESGFVILFSEERNVDPFEGSFFFPKHTPKLAVVNSKGKELWRRELPYSIPGTWFIPVLPMDMNGDGVDEIYYVANIGELPFNYDTYKLECADPLTGKVTGQYDWSAPSHNQANSYKWRFQLVGGYVNNEPVLVTIQGTYRDIKLQAWNKDMKKRWSIYYPDDYKGSRGSHSTAIIDVDFNGRYQFMCGERCIPFDTGKEMFVLDGDVWGDHSDVVLPFYDAKAKSWNFFTAREKGDDGKMSRSVTFDRNGKHLWEIDEKLGHYHYGWVGNFGEDGQRVAMAGRYPFKNEKYAPKSCVGKYYDAQTGKELSLNIPMTGTVVDFDGDGIHEMFNNGNLYDNNGEKIFDIKNGSKCSMVIAKKILPLAGEQIMVSFPSGRVQIWADANAKDSDVCKVRFNDPVYKMNVKHSATGYNNRFPILNY